MAKKKGQSDSSNFQSGVDAGTSSFTKGLVSDYDENFIPDSNWVYARNAINNSLEGDVGLLGNESSNYECASAPYTIIGRVHLFEQYWTIFSTDNLNSEIGIYDENLCSYRTVVNDPCLSFSLNNFFPSQTHLSSNKVFDGNDKEFEKTLNSSYLTRYSQRSEYCYDCEKNKGFQDKIGGRNDITLPR